MYIILYYIILFLFHFDLHQYAESNESRQTFVHH